MKKVFLFVTSFLFITSCGDNIIDEPDEVLINREYKSNFCDDLYKTTESNPNYNGSFVEIDSVCVGWDINGNCNDSVSYIMDGYPYYEYVCPDTVDNIDFYIYLDGTQTSWNMDLLTSELGLLCYNNKAKLKVNSHGKITGVTEGVTIDVTKSEIFWKSSPTIGNMVINDISGNNPCNNRNREESTFSVSGVSSGDWFFYRYTLTEYIDDNGNALVTEHSGNFCFVVQ